MSSRIDHPCACAVEGLAVLFWLARGPAVELTPHFGHLLIRLSEPLYLFLEAIEVFCFSPDYLGVAINCVQLRVVSYVLILLALIRACVLRGGRLQVRWGTDAEAKGVPAPWELCTTYWAACAPRVAPAATGVANASSDASLDAVLAADTAMSAHSRAVRLW